MSTNFFTQIAPHLSGVDLVVTIKMIDDKITLSVLPKPRIDDKAKEQIHPLIISDASPEDLDQSFFKAMGTPLEKVTSWSQSMKQFEDDMTKAEQESKRQKKKDDEKKEAIKQADVKLKRANELFGADKCREALTHVEKALVLVPDYDKALKLQKEIKNKLGESISLFSNPKESSTETVES